MSPNRIKSQFDSAPSAGPRFGPELGRFLGGEGAVCRAAGTSFLFALRGPGGLQGEMTSRTHDFEKPREPGGTQR